MVGRTTTSNKYLRCSCSFGLFVKRKPSLVVDENVIFYLSVLSQNVTKVASFIVNKVGNQTGVAVLNVQSALDLRPIYQPFQIGWSRVVLHIVEFVIWLAVHNSSSFYFHFSWMASREISLQFIIKRGVTLALCEISEVYRCVNVLRVSKVWLIQGEGIIPHKQILQMSCINGKTFLAWSIVREGIIDDSCGHSIDLVLISDNVVRYLKSSICSCRGEVGCGC